MRLAALFALQPYAIGSDLSGVDSGGYGEGTPLLDQSLRLRHNQYDVDYILSTIRGTPFEPQAIPLALGLLAGPEFVSSEASAVVAGRLRQFHSNNEGEDAYIAYCLDRILGQRR